MITNLLRSSPWVIWFWVLFLPLQLSAQKDVPLPGIVLPNTIRAGYNSFVEKGEVTNFQWKEFLYAVSKDSGEATARKYLPYFKLGELWQRYFFDTQYDDYPVVGISWEQVQTYCHWRSRQINILWKNRKLTYADPKALPVLPGKADYEVFELIFRLPKPREFDELLEQNLHGCPGYPIGDETAINSELYFNVQVGINRLMPIRNAANSKPLTNGILNLLGNVAEMTQTKGIAKGGSWYHGLNQTIIGSEIEYQEPASWLGFRCVIEFMAK